LEQLKREQGLTSTNVGASARMVESKCHLMPEPWSDRQVILAITLTLILVFGLILGTVSYNQKQQAPMLWRETPQPQATPLAI
tara:strand:- start:134 stop:382 length:249 start_codon:yes stop_codon:yes gene_type:complete